MLKNKCAWVPKACIAATHDTDYLFALRDCFGVGLRATGTLTYLRQETLHLDSLRALMAYIQWRCSTMAQFRWNPKPCVCFQRKGVGTILVIGKEIIQFDATFNPILRKDVQTHYQGMQEAMLLVGATITDKILIEDSNEDEDEGINSLDET